MTISPDMAALNYGQADEPANEIDTLATMAAEYGYRLVPINSDETVNAVIPAASPDTPEDMVRRLTWLQAAIKSGKAAVSAHEKERREVSEALQEKWMEVGRSSDTIDGYTAFFAPSYSYARNEDVTTDDLIEALRKAKLGHLISSTFSYQSLLALLKEMDEQNMPIPEALAGLITFKKGHQIKVTPAGKKRGGGPANPFTGA